MLLWLCSVIAKYPSLDTDGIDAVNLWSKGFVTQGEHSFSASGLKRYPSPEFWGSEIVYSIIVDRFNNGNPLNDKDNLPVHQLNQTEEYHDYRQGGDIKGIIDRLDYLQHLGITTIWVSPVLRHNGNFHGYCLTNPAEIDPGFGTAEELRQLTTEAHKRNMKVVLDIVINHLCDNQTKYSKVPDNHQRCAEDLDSQHWSNSKDGSKHQGELKFSPNFFGPFKSQNFFARCGANSVSDTAGDGPTTIFGDFVDIMFDFDTRDNNFQKVFTDIHKYWIAYADIDGYRLDAAKHVTEDFIAYFSTMTREYARSIGKANFYIVGEVAANVFYQGRRLGTMFSNPQNPDEHGNGQTSVPVSLTSRMKELMPVYLNNPTARYPGMNAIYDFQLSGSAKDVFQSNAPLNSLGEWISGNGFRTVDGQGDMRLSWQMIEIHDWPRFLYRRGDWWAMNTAFSFLFTTFGQPIIYYGAEQGFNGNCKITKDNVKMKDSSVKSLCEGPWVDHTSRQSMFESSGFRLGSAVPEIDNLAFLGPNSPIKPGPYDWKNDKFLNLNNGIYKGLRRLIGIRKSCSVLSLGRTVIRRLDDQKNGIMIFSRIFENKEIVVMINAGAGDQHISSVPVDPAVNAAQDQKYRMLLDYNIAGITQKGGQGMEIRFNPAYKLQNWNYAIFVQENNIAKQDKDLETFLCKQ